MKKSIFLLFLCALASIFAISSCQKESPVNYRELFRDVDTAMARQWKLYKEKYGIPNDKNLSVVIGYSYKNKFDFLSYDIYVPHNSRFRIGQNTMSFTSAGILYLEQNGWLHVESPVVGFIPTTSQRFLPDEAAYDLPYKRALVIEHMMRHTSGIFDLKTSVIPKYFFQPYAGRRYYEYVEENFGSDYQYTYDEQSSVIANNYIFDFTPDNGFKVSHSAYNLLAKMIDRISGRDYDRFIGLNFIGEQGLYFTSSPMIAYDTLPLSPYTRGYKLSTDGGVRDVSSRNMSWAIGSANMISSPYDMIRWNKNLVNGKTNLGRTGTNKMKDISKSQKQGIATSGLGIYYFDDIGWGNTGLVDGYVSLVVFNPELDLSMCFYFNFTDERTPEGMENQKEELFNFARELTASIKLNAEKTKNQTK